ncbi:hypothetical protein FQA39_LY06548 [Lamprigera yunnana]|nr:hypothetical protein FQA39_LY06548 [Lamprigera yunnana]
MVGQVMVKTVFCCGSEVWTIRKEEKKYGDKPLTPSTDLVLMVKILCGGEVGVGIRMRGKESLGLGLRNFLSLLRRGFVVSSGADDWAEARRKGTEKSSDAKRDTGEPESETESTTEIPTAQFRHGMETEKQRSTTGITERTIRKEKGNVEEQHESEGSELEEASNEDGLRTL